MPIRTGAMIKDILIIRLSSIGDVIHCTPVVSSIKAVWPNCRITWLVGEVCADLIKYNPFIDEIIVWSREKFEKHLNKLEFAKAASSWRSLRGMLSGRRFDAVLDIQGLFITGLIARIPMTERRIGLSDAREFNSMFMTETVKPLGQHITERYLGVLASLGITAVNKRMIVVVPEEYREFAKRLLAGEGLSPETRYIVIVPGTTWSSKTWSATSYARVASMLSKDFRLVLCGGIAEATIAQQITDSVKSPVINVVGRTGLLDMGGIIQGAEVVIAGDTGPLYMAAALGTSTVGIFGPTNPVNLAPSGPNHGYLVNRLSCSFCHKRRCPRGEAHCINTVQPEDVVQKVYSIVGNVGAIPGQSFI
jgi:lipopolysaccharide heptosyltransferase I